MRRSAKHPTTLLASTPISPHSPPASPQPTTPCFSSFPQDIDNSVASNSTHNLPFGSVRLNPATVDQRGAAFSASRDSVAATHGKMLRDTPRHHWRAGSIRSKSQPSLQDKVAKLHTEAVGVDDHVPYRPPYDSSSLSLSAPVKPSGAQGIGLAPAPAAPQERPQKKTILGWFGRRKVKEKLASVSTPTLIEAEPLGKHGQGYPRFGHRPRAAQSADLLGSSSGAGTGMTDSASVLTGLIAPKMLFSPLSRSIRAEGMDNHPYGSTYPSAPHIQHLPLQQERPPYPRVGNNSSTPALHGQRTNTPELDNVVNPDDPNSSFDRVYAAGEIREAERTEWATITRRSRNGSMRSLISRRRSDEWSVPEHQNGTPVHGDHEERLERLPERGASFCEADRSDLGSPPSKLRRRQTGPPRTFQFRLQPPTHRHAPSGTNLVMVGGATAPDHSRLDSSRLHVKHPPRNIDFVAGSDPNRLSTSPPHLPTPERSSPFDYDFPESEIGMAITTDQVVAPAQHRLPMDTPPSCGPQTREDPSSAHARYVLARQHRRQQTMRAFQSPPVLGDGKKAPDIYPQQRFSHFPANVSECWTERDELSGQ
ncbi:hypothetical protein CspeluHIS016_0602320 [Cutaneotrichosporon spelunceum]|uniref:Uncharacterized protein n=1 Tax=Cutaneotrichosporon spelunceum TaxID=1672016 RepID=A0AAD3YD40_9TREE|nr:hypothetical protein CspeluHIS016_0602320 [Cutaneotrichosporon spelunceum]